MFKFSVIFLVFCCAVAAAEPPQEGTFRSTSDLVVSAINVSEIIDNTKMNRSVCVQNIINKIEIIKGKFLSSVEGLNNGSNDNLKDLADFGDNQITREIITELKAILPLCLLCSYKENTEEAYIKVVVQSILYNIKLYWKSDSDLLFSNDVIECMKKYITHEDIYSLAKRENGLIMQAIQKYSVMETDE